MKCSEIWVVIGSGTSWGKGETFNDAIGNMIKNDSRSYPSKSMHVYRIEEGAPDDLEWTDVSVDGMGCVSWPLTAKVRKLVDTPIPSKLIKSFTAFDDEVDEYVNSTPFDTAFP